MNTYNGLPLFKLNVVEGDPGITTISLVEFPAMEMPMVMFSEDKKDMYFSIQDESKHNILTLIARTDYPIIRVSPEGDPYYVIFTKEVTEKLCQRLMKEGYAQNVSTEHSGKLIEGIQLQEVFLKDTSKGISPVGYEEAAEGSLFGVYHITDDALWKDCLEGKFTNVSLESYFTLEKFNKIDNKKNNRFSMNKIKNILRKLLLEFNSLSTNIAELYWEEDTELMVGYKVFVEDESGNKVPAMDGEYISDENKIKVAGGVVTEIEKKEIDDVPAEVPAEKKEDVMEEPAMEEPAKEEPKEEPATEEPKDDNTEKVAELEKKVADLETKLADLETKLAEIATAPAAEPVVDEFENIKKRGTTGDKKLDKRIAIAQALREN